MISEDSHNDGRKRTVISLCSLLLGLTLLYMGNQELQSLQRIESPFSVSLENRSLWYLIIGTAATVTGFIGLIRRNAL